MALIPHYKVRMVLQDLKFILQTLDVFLNLIRHLG